MSQLVTRVLIVDDSSTLRALLRAAIASDDALELAGEASTGTRITEMVHRTQPDVVLLDIEMRGGNGLEALSSIRASWPDLPVVMFSRHNPTSSPKAAEALNRGASGIAVKPRAASVAQSRDAITRDVLPLLKSAHRKTTPLPAPSRRPTKLALSAPKPVDVVVIGASTGGPQALTTLLSGIPEDFTLPILVVQHMPASFTGIFAERLNRSTPLTVREAQHGDALRGGTIYVAPGHSHLAVDSPTRVALTDTPPENSCKPAADVLFRSAAEAFHGRVLAVLLTGMGTDGTEGALHIVNAGGTLLCQDEASSVVWGMPGSAVRAGLAQSVLPIEALAGAVINIVRGSE